MKETATETALKNFERTPLIDFALILNYFVIIFNAQQIILAFIDCRFTNCDTNPSQIFWHVKNPFLPETNDNDALRVE
jgi:hypothetical protein